MEKNRRALQAIGAIAVLGGLILLTRRAEAVPVEPVPPPPPGLPTPEVAEEEIAEATVKTYTTLVELEADYDKFLAYYKAGLVVQADFEAYERHYLAERGRLEALLPPVPEIPTVTVSIGLMDRWAQFDYNCFWTLTIYNVSGVEWRRYDDLPIDARAAWTDIPDNWGFPLDYDLAVYKWVVPGETVIQLYHCQTYAPGAPGYLPSPSTGWKKIVSPGKWNFSFRTYSLWYIT